MSCHLDRPHDPGRREERHVLRLTDLATTCSPSTVSWRYYLAEGTEPDCRADGDDTCVPQTQLATVPSIWNPLPHFADVGSDDQLGNVQGVGRFFAAARSGRLPNVSWIVPSYANSEHPPAAPRVGEAWVTRLVNAVMRARLELDRDLHLLGRLGRFTTRRRRVDGQGYGLRCPPDDQPRAARGGDHQTLSFTPTSVHRRLPRRRPPRPGHRRPARLAAGVHEAAPQLGDVFSSSTSQPPRKPFTCDPVEPALPIGSGLRSNQP
jgi:hypothetical protein